MPDNLDYDQWGRSKKKERNNLEIKKKKVQDDNKRKKKLQNLDDYEKDLLKNIWEKRWKRNT